MSESHPEQTPGAYFNIFHNPHRTTRQNSLSSDLNIPFHDLHPPRLPRRNLDRRRLPCFEAVEADFDVLVDCKASIAAVGGSYEDGV